MREEFNERVKAKKEEKSFRTQAGGDMSMLPLNNEFEMYGVPQVLKQNRAVFSPFASQYG